MALIKCPECGQQVSDAAKQCPHCGLNINKNRKSTKRLKYIILSILGIMCLVGVGVYILLIRNHQGSIESKEITETEEIVKITPEFISAIHKYDEISSFSEGMAAVSRNGLWGYIDIKGNEIIPCQYKERVGRFSNGLACVPKKGSDFDVLFIDKKGKIIIDGYGMPIGYLKSRYWSASIQPVLPNFINGLCEVTINKNNTQIEEDYVPCVINIKGEAVNDTIKNTEEDPNDGVLTPFYVGEVADKWGYKDKDGNMVISPRYDLARDFNNGVGLVVMWHSDPMDYNCIPGIIIYGFVDEQGNDTFTEEDYTRLEEYRNNALRMQAERQREEYQRQEIQNKNNTIDFTVTMSARFNRYGDLENRYSNLGDNSGRIHNFVTKRCRVAENKNLKYVSYKNNSTSGVSISEIFIEVIDRNGRSKAIHYLTDVGEFNIMGGESFYIQVEGIQGDYNSKDHYINDRFEMEVLFREF